MIVSLLMLIVVLVLGVSLANMSLQGEKSSRSDRDRQVALSAAEAAVKDAELDIDPQGTPSANSRGATFDPTSNIAFVAGCGSGTGNITQGLCAPAVVGTGKPIWQTVNLADDSSNGISVAYGTFTGQTMVLSKASFPVKVPRYIIEAVPDIIPPGVADAGQAEYANDAKSGKKFLYRITAIGFGANLTTQVVLQSFYRKAIN
ncbi:PilX N-terminal domain-containing pilus assembly protein [Undibacterium sp. RTI2.1]|uniref:pilus assembly PilX family protein n=1 Tax=unclassified Undibacterium TaxID=2630295 RepID=UPI002AB5C27D|nr:MULTISPECIES: PilX N-terminal domain-containing pilus assembly protein [unclassified Undibacterium]MDY7537338.1 PilX N-terminal domain-containing pilus assembly protein [Undibacterium sp. 5I1]MEB0033106.1 PilX N-terminal domain-containing pilus assembly protein [Undibacterium sp. RTI2.1]MEB0118913.1 PilX N-terminal domain-containing pilus assembly protein [Undibacterium sp. RTI2.2]MEB0233085.1 PilX N-terminal domain-containing pilus assembly protein [Undibacterium sp. 10I3]MEB0259838.1 PilX